MNKNTIKKALIMGTLSLMALLTTGCGDKIKQFANTTLSDAVIHRIDENRRILTELKNADFINESTYNSYLKSLQEKEEEYLKEKVEINENNLDKSSFVSCIRRLNYVDGYSLHLCGHDVINGDNGGEDKVYWYSNDKGEYVWADSKYNLDFGGGNKAKLNELYLINFLGTQVNFQFENDRLRLYNNSPHGYTNGDKCSNGDNCKDHHKLFYRNGNIGLKRKKYDALELIGDDVTADINSRFQCPVYVLKPDMITGDGAQSLDAIIAAVQGAITIDSNGKKHVDTRTLDDYFTVAKDINGNEIKLLDGLEGFQLIVESEDQSLNEPNPKTEPGFDSIIYQDNVPCFTVHYKEFSSENYERLKALIGINSNQYVYSTDGNGGRMYLLEYPVYKLNYLYNDNVNNVRGTFSESGIGVNLYTKKIIKYEPIKSDNRITGWSKTGTEVSELVDNYLTLGGEINGGRDGQSAFVVSGNCDVEVTFKINSETGNITKKMECGRILLRDYLEATYAPEMVNGENLVVFGRKIRLNFNRFDNNENVIWDKDEPMAYYVDKDGNKLSTANALRITDFCDASSLLLEDTVKTFSYKGESNRVTIPAKEVDAGKLKTISDLEEIRLLPGTGQCIKATMLFPGENIGKTDFNSDSSSKQRFYAIATKKGIFDSGLYSNWINTSNPDASLDWWNKYLADNNFSYSVLHQDVNDYLIGNYSYELSQSGVVILDLDTVAFIQEQMDKDSDVGRVEVIRTIFIILGWGIICYSLVLVLAWILDTNSDIGIDLLTKLTFGHWIAVKYKEDIPSYDTSDNKYISSSGLMLSVIILIAVGIILLNINIFDLVIAIIKTFGKFASQVEKMIKGM